MSIFPEDNDVRCGYKWLSTSSHDKFLNACAIHDMRYGEHDLKGDADPFTRKAADKEFLQNMLQASGDSVNLKIRAYLYYGFVRGLGWLVW